MDEWGGGGGELETLMCVSCVFCHISLPTHIHTCMYVRTHTDK